MNMTPESARTAIADVEHTMARARYVFFAGDDLILMAWGVVWMICFALTQFMPHMAGWIWLIGNGLGGAFTAIVCSVVARKRPVHSPQIARTNRQMFWFWLALFLFADVWLLILFPWRGEQLGTFFVTLIMFAYVIVGMWMRQRNLIVLGVGVTIATLVGYALDMGIRADVIDMPRILNLWLAVTGGGALLLTGILMRQQRRDKP